MIQWLVGWLTVRFLLTAIGNNNKKSQNLIFVGAGRGQSAFGAGVYTNKST